MLKSSLSAMLLCLCSMVLTHADEKPQRISSDPNDWSTYNYDFRGYRYNSAEKTLSPANVGQLTELWRFPAKDSKEKIGSVNCTPVVVNGEVYFGTATNAAFYKLDKNGKLAWKFENRDENGKIIGTIEGPFGLSMPGAFVGSALVTQDYVYFGDTGGYVYCLHRKTGKPKWKINTRAKPFPGYHKANAVFSSPILAEGAVIIAGGGYEHDLGSKETYPCCAGRGFVMALEPTTGKVLWKYDVGPTPQKFDPPIVIEDDWGKHVFHYGPSTSSVWCTPSYDPKSHTLFFGTDVHNSPRKPTKDDPKNYTKHSAAVIAVDSRDGKEKWVTQVNSEDVWNYGLRAYNPKTKKYKDQSIGDTPKIYEITWKGRKTKAVGCGCKNGVFYVMRASDGKLIAHTPLYTGPPTTNPKTDPRTLALPGAAGGLQTGCATDGKSVFTNGMDHNQLSTAKKKTDSRFGPPLGGRVTCISLDTKKEHWRHERDKVAQVAQFKNVGDPVASGIALANGVAYFTTVVSNYLVVLDTRDEGKVLKQIKLGPVWCGPSVSRGRVYVGTGNIFFMPFGSEEAYFPKSLTGTVRCYGLPASR